MREQLEVFRDMVNKYRDGVPVTKLCYGLNNDHMRVLCNLLPEEGIPRYGCHCDLYEDMEPDGCVFDDGHIDDCVHAMQMTRDGLTQKELCMHWRKYIL